MPVTARPLEHCPFLLENDILSLSNDFAVNGEVVYDIPLKAAHQLHPSAGVVMAALVKGSPYSTVQRIAHTQNIPDSQLNELLGFLNLLGALERKRSARQTLAALRTHLLHLFFGRWYMPLAWRRTATFAAIVWGVARATLPLIAAVVCVATLATTAGLIPARISVPLSIFGLIVFGLSLVVHEMVHVRLASRRYIRPRVLQIGLRLGIVHRRLPPRAEALSSLAGPLAGSTTGMLFALPAMAMGAHWFGITAGVIALFHSLSLLPWYGDGASFHKALRAERRLRA